MSQRAFIRQAEIERALKAARKNGWRVEIDCGVIKFLPIDPDAPLPSTDESAFQRAIGKWRQSA